MMKILIYLLVFCLFALLSFALRNKLGAKVVPFFVILCVLSVAGAVFYELNLKSKKRQYEKLLLAFSNSKELICKENVVSKDKFNYDYGTKSFIIKDKSVKLLIFNIKECALNDE